MLSHLRVIDCGTFIAGPAAATILSDFGAEVIKIERPPYGDPYRYLSLVPGMPISGQLYCWILEGRNKKSVALNLNHASAREVLLKLVATADVFVTNYQPQVLEKLGIDYERLRPIYPRLIYAHVTGYGETGPEADKPGYDMTAYWARSGLMDAMHNVDADPSQSVAGFGDHPTATALFSAIMLALYQRERTGAGMKVRTSLIANGAWSNACNIQAAMVQAKRPILWARKNAINPIVNHYVTRDKKRFILCCLEPPKDWPNLCRALNHAELTGDPRFATQEARAANCVELIAMFDRWIGEKEMAEWARIFVAHEIVHGLVPPSEEVPDDAQMEADKVFADFADAPNGPLRTVSSPIRIDGFEKKRPQCAPEVGQHTVEILQSLGYTPEAIHSLLESKAALAARHAESC